MLELENLWKEFKESGSQAAKDKLLVEYSHLVKYTAQRLAINLPPSVDRDDLYSAGILGLIKAGVTSANICSYSSIVTPSSSQTSSS